MTFADDFRMALDSGLFVEVTTRSGECFGLVGVHEVDPQGEWVSLWTPTTFEDTATCTRVDLAAIQSVSVSDIAFESQA